MKSYNPSLFYRELLETLSDYFSTAPSDAQQIMSDVLFSLQNILIMLSQCGEQRNWPQYDLCMQSLRTLDEKLSGAQQFHEMVSAILDADTDARGAERKELVEQLMILVKFSHDKLN